MERDKDSGKFIPSENSLTKLFGMKVNQDLWQWIKQQGGSDYVRSLVERDRLEQSKKLQTNPHQNQHPNQIAA
ncbi:hypothetical protein [Nostoc sp.]